MSFNLGQMEPSKKGKSPMPISLGTQQLSSTNKQSAQVDLLPRFHTAMPVNFGSQQLSSSVGDLSQGMVQTSMPINQGSYSLTFTNSQPVQLGLPPMSIYMGFQQLSSTEILPSGKEQPLSVLNPIPVSVGSQLSSSNKRPAQRQALPKFQNFMPSNTSLQQLSSTNKRPAQMEPPPKSQTESFESVRSKLRESLAASLAMASHQQEKPQIVEKKSPKEAAPSTPRQAEAETQQIEPCSAASNASLCGSSSESLISNEQIMMHDEGQALPSDIGPSKNTIDNRKVWKSNVEEDEPVHISLEDEASFSNNSIIKDELLQGHGLCWASDHDAEKSDTLDEPLMKHGLKRPKLAHEEVSEDTKGTPLQTPESLATKIEAELFKLFGGVNKKYKEKGRSLLFNLKDRSNPELRERVLSGEITPERLCSMTAEELASKELSEWRLAKAEELAQMVVLPDSDVDIRRLVKKTHKGEFQVEVENDDNVSVEVAVGTSVLYQVPAKANEEAHTHSKSNDKGQALSKFNQKKASEGLQPSEKGDSGDQNASSNLDVLLNEKADFMQDFMVDELKDTEFLPPIVSLDEFMEALDSEPPFENLSVDTAQNITSPAEKISDSLEPEANTASDSMAPDAGPAADNLGSKVDSQDGLSSKLHPEDKGLGDIEEIAADSNGKEDVKHTTPDDKLKPGSLHVVADSSAPDSAFDNEKIWEGLIQLNFSVLVTVIGFFRSGEKPSTQEWPTFLEIKGRVRLDAFEKFIQELPLSRSRALMVTHFCWKGGSHESGRLNLCETVDSYIADERVGFAEPAPGVELYLCPPHPKTTEMLGRHLPKEHSDALHSTVNGLIGVVVWRRPHVTTISPRLPSHKHGSSSTKRQFSSRKQHNVTINSNSSRSSHPSGPNPSNPQPPPDESIDDVPPGFGPGPSRDEDDLPEFDFVHNSSRIPTPTPSQQSGVNMAHCAQPTSARPVEQMRELIHKYGQSEAPKNQGFGIEVQPWNDDDDIPEWQPHQDKQPQPKQQFPVRPLPPPQVHAYQRQSIQPFLVNQQMVPLAQPTGPQQQLLPLAASMSIPFQQSLQPQMGVMPGPQNVNPGWLQPQWWSPARGPANVGVGVGLPMNGQMQQPCHFGAQPSEGQFNGMSMPMPMPGFGPVQNGGVGWRPDVPRGRGV